MQLPPLLALGIWGLPLWTAAAGAAPVIIHLLNRLRYDRVRWAAMEFLLESRKKNRQRVRLEQLLLLLIRILIMLLLSAAFARIAWGPDPQKQAAAEGGPESHVILLDVSMSMGAKVGGSTALAEGAAEVKRILAKLKPDDELCLVLVGRHPEVIRPPAVPGQGEIEGLGPVLSELRPTDTEADFGAALERLYGRDRDGKEVGLLLQSDPKKKKVIHVIGDFRRRNWAVGHGGSAAVVEAFNGLKQRFSAVLDPVDAAATAADAAPANLSILDFRPKPSELSVFSGGTVPADRDIDFIVRLRNHGGTDQDARLAMYVDGRRQGPVVGIRVPAGEEITESIKLTFPRSAPGTTGGANPPAYRFAESAVVLVGRGGEPLTENDALAADNRRMLALKVVEGVRVMLVTGDIAPADVEKGFALPLLSAMTPRPREGDNAATAVQVRHLDEPAFQRLAIDEASGKRGAFRDVDCLVLSNVDQVPAALVPELGRFVSGGGLLAIFCGDRLKTAVYNEELFRRDMRILPAALEEPVDAVRIEGRPVGLSAGSMNLEHPLFADLALMMSEKTLDAISPTGILVNRFFRLRAEAKSAPAGAGGATKADEDTGRVQVLARYTDRTDWGGKPGSPAVIQRTVGRGHVLLFTTTAGEPWNDWATDRQRRGSFLIAVQAMVQFSVAERIAEIEAGREFASELPAPGSGSERAARVSELRSLSPSRRDDPMGRSEWRPVSDLKAVPGEHSAAASFTRTEHSGFYRITAGGQAGEVVEMFAVNPAVAEGDLTRLAPAERKGLFGGQEPRPAATGEPPTAPSAVEAVVEPGDPDELRPPFTPFDQAVCQWMLAAMMVLLLVETVLARRFAHYTSD
jgi:hypothetical protein